MLDITGEPVISSTPYTWCWCPSYPFSVLVQIPSVAIEGGGTVCQRHPVIRLDIPSIFMTSQQLFGFYIIIHAWIVTMQMIIEKGGWGCAPYPHLKRQREPAKLRSFSTTVRRTQPRAVKQDRQRFKPKCRHIVAGKLPRDIYYL